MSKREDLAFFPWEDVGVCDNNSVFFVLFSKILKEKKRSLPCPQCGTPSKELRWIWFESPSKTWDNLMGQAGFLSICEKCHRQVDFICVMRN